MNEPDFDVLGIGNAIVDVMARTEEDFLAEQRLSKGTMHLIDAERAEGLYGAMGPAIEASGGSAGNTAAGVASLGGRAAFIGKVADDPLGHFYRHDMHAAGVHFATGALQNGAPTARSFILITPDGERTMNTYLGACRELSPADIDAEVVGASAVTYLEGYLWDPREAKDAFLKAARIAHEADRTVALTLSDAFCVDRWRDEFLDLIRRKTVDLLFANEAELHSLYQTADLETALSALRNDAGMAVVTRSEQGCLIVTREGTQAVPALPVERVVDTTGAGDLFAAGFLFGIARGAPPETAARLGALCAAEIIQHVGARPETSLKALAADAGLSL